MVITFVFEMDDVGSIPTARPNLIITTTEP